jgi:outer membrane lipoprotein-sorting protein
MKLTKAGSALILAAIIFSGCGAQQIKIGTAKAELKTFKAYVMASFTGPGRKIKKKSLLAVKAPDMLRFEIKGFFNEPFFMLVAKGNRVQIHFVAENAYYEGEMFAKSSASPASIFLNMQNGLILKADDLKIASTLFKKSKDSDVLTGAEFTGGDYRLSFSFIEPEINNELDDSLFELPPPKKAHLISEAELNRYFSKWKK